MVTGTGQVRDCSPARNGDLFDRALAGLGQFGVITRATVDLVPAKERARTYVLPYPDIAAAFGDLRVLLDRPGLDHVILAVVPASTGGFAKVIKATVFYDPATPPDDLALTGGLSTTPVVQDAGFLDFAFAGDGVIDHNRATLGWDRFVKPWFNVWLPASTVEPYVSEVVAALTHRDVGATGSVLLAPQRRSRRTRPFPRIPDRDGSDWVYSFNMLSAADSLDPGPDFVPGMLARNSRLFHRARDTAGGVLYPIGAVPMSESDWRIHYGPEWHSFAAAKNRFDPRHILAPGAGIFTQ